MWHLDKQDPVSGSLLLTHPGLDEAGFPALAPALLAAWELRLVEREQGADRHCWVVDFEGSKLLLQYEHYGEVCWLEVCHPDDRPLLDWLARHQAAQGLHSGGEGV
ncbi:DUF3630 family protein [Aeromonas schubertii]|uniref:DUF3630 family protein n=1 Tax=Aeromonas schubertii TaxID=652 RepID=UPI001CC5CE22|nr:DUF3630 family protein [Aeromonas schubertii]MBZ6072737.1 DUF3630 family protein [Aeromonas schubertii]